MSPCHKSAFGLTQGSHQLWPMHHRFKAELTGFQSPAQASRAHPPCHHGGNGAWLVRARALQSETWFKSCLFHMLALHLSRSQDFSVHICYMDNSHPDYSAQNLVTAQHNLLFLRKDLNYGNLVPSLLCCGTSQANQIVDGSGRKQ